MTKSALLAALAEKTGMSKKDVGNFLDVMANLAYVEFKKIDKDVIKIAGGESKIEPLEISRPKSGE